MINYYLLQARSAGDQFDTRDGQQKGKSAYKCIVYLSELMRVEFYTLLT